jgi:hypothetical protein
MSQYLLFWYLRKESLNSDCQQFQQYQQTYNHFSPQTNEHKKALECWISGSWFWSVAKISGGVKLVMGFQLPPPGNWISNDNIDTCKNK